VVPEADTVGFVGLGRMGLPMSRRLVAAGWRVIGYDVSEEARAAAKAVGVEDVGGLGAVSGAHLVVLMLPSSPVVASVIGDRAFRAGLVRGTIVADMSSSEPVRTQELARDLAAGGVRMIDAPVSGGVGGAEEGKLTVMVGGAAPDIEEARPCLEVFGRVVRAGPVGAGHAVKALNNLLSATHLWVTSEAVLAGRRFGVQPSVMLEIFNSSSGRSGSTDNKWPNFILPATYNSGFGLGLMVKDMAIAVQLAQQVGVPSRLGGAALELWEEAAEGLPPGADHTEIARWLERGTNRDQ
jgi:3-hydroxyisobutyrate dehydrogenase